MSFPQSCSCVSSTLIVCQSPAAIQSQQATARFYLNEVLYRGEDASPFGTRARRGRGASPPMPFTLTTWRIRRFYTANKENSSNIILESLSSSSSTWVCVCRSFSHRQHLKEEFKQKGKYALLQFIVHLEKFHQCLSNGCSAVNGCHQNERCTLSLEEALLWIMDWSGVDIVMFLADSHSDGTHSHPSLRHFYKPDEETNSSWSWLAYIHFQQMLILAELIF